MVLTLIFFMLLLMSVQTSGSSSLVTLKCESVTVVVSQSAEIKCTVHIEAINNTFNVYRATLCRPPTGSCGTDKNKTSVFEYRDNETADDVYRFQLLNKSGVSLMLPYTTAFDNGEYKYKILTNRGPGEAIFKINVTAKYNIPVISSVRNKLMDDSKTEVYCNATAGYPAGTIQWFDESDTNLTRNSTLQVIRREDGLFNLYSKLSSSSKTKYKCVVLNSRYQPEDESSQWGTFEGNPVEKEVRYTAAGAIGAVGLLLAGLIVFLIFTVRRRRQNFRRPSTTPFLGQLQEDYYDVETEALH